MKNIILFLLFIPYITFANNEGSKQLKIIKLTDNVYQHVSYKNVEPWGLIGASGLIVINDTAAYLIDTPWTSKGTKQLIDWVEAKGLTLNSVVVTHFHEDASGDIPLLSDLKIKTYATSLTNKLLESNNKQISSDEISNDEFEFIEGVASVYYPGAGHTEDNIVVWLPNEKILFGGCFVKSLNNKTLGYTGDADIIAWPNSLQKVINRYPDVNLVIPGHGKIGDISLLTHTKALALSAISSNKSINK